LTEFRKERVETENIVRSYYRGPDGRHCIFEYCGSDRDIEKKLDSRSVSKGKLKGCADKFTDTNLEIFLTRKYSD
jgi:hypothetical protein